MNIYVGNLAYGMTEDDLNELFGAYGSVIKANLITDRDTGNSKGFAFVEMKNQADAEQAIKELDGSSQKGRNIKVNQAKPRAPRPQSRPRY